MTWEDVIFQYKEMGLDSNKVYEAVCPINEMAKVIKEEDSKKAAPLK